MKFGSWEIETVIAGRFGLDGGAMFGVVPKTMWAKVAPPDDANRISMVMRPMVLVGDERKVIVDCGAGSGYPEKLAKIYALEDTPSMDDVLSPLGITPAEITDVIVTHLHFDHGGGLATPDGDGWRPTFPNATHHVQKLQWEHALNPNPRDRASYFRDRIIVLENKNVLSICDGDWEFAPGVRLRNFHGHTPGQQLPVITDGDRTLFFCGDLIPTSMHFPIPYIMAYDLQPVLAMEEKTALLEEAALQQWVLFFEHDPNVERCRVQGENGRWNPVDKHPTI